MKDFSKILKSYSSVLNAKNGIQTAFGELKNIFDYDICRIYYISAEKIHLKFFHDYIEDFKIEKNDFPHNLLSKNIFGESQTILLSEKSKFLKNLDINTNIPSSFLVSKLIIRGAVFGFIILGKTEESYFSQQDKEIFSGMADVISYVVKDSELSDIFNSQLSMLQEAIEDKKAALKVIKEQNKKIVQANKIKNDFMANVSHELRTPLTAIIGFSELLKSNVYGQLSEKQYFYVNNIHTSGIHLLGMINELLDIAKIESKTMKLLTYQFDLQQCVQEVVNVLMPLAIQKNIEIILNIPQIQIKADFQKLQQVFYNLINNAIKFTPENGKIKLYSELKKEQIILFVEDNGVGIAKENHKKIFDKFVQLENTYTKKGSSTGLGLTITKKIIQLHKGKISLISELDKGTTFIITLPLNIES